jgi:hypothetical protein
VAAVGPLALPVGVPAAGPRRGRPHPHASVSGWVAAWVAGGIAGGFARLPGCLAGLQTPNQRCHSPLLLPPCLAHSLAHHRAPCPPCPLPSPSRLPPPAFNQLKSAGVFMLLPAAVATWQTCSSCWRERRRWWRVQDGRAAAHLVCEQACCPRPACAGLRWLCFDSS